jgi:hypothetical protein
MHLRNFFFHALDTITQPVLGKFPIKVKISMSISNSVSSIYSWDIYGKASWWSYWILGRIYFSFYRRLYFWNYVFLNTVTHSTHDWAGSQELCSDECLFCTSQVALKWPLMCREYRNRKWLQVRHLRDTKLNFPTKNIYTVLYYVNFLPIELHKVHAYIVARVFRVLSIILST